MEKKANRKVLGQVQLGTALTDIYVPPPGTGNVVAGSTCIIICNTDSAPHTFTLRAGSASPLTAANSLFENCNLLANTTYVLNQAAWGVAIGRGMKLQGLADTAAKITVTVTGEEYI